ncbi:hypothetical protein O181_003435 [Austropuccinia psidii MF-1]|uniref:Uncharacterized protein n=1 Tax=Austropuccinia psidii MF-1 TaxID=1389203 RepID=A0A9Q3GDX1_9BASI|nr:hypothetical protein [Austropuccinia psidii MF-1]
MEFMKKLDMLKEELNISSEYISSRLNSLFSQSEKEWYYKMRKDHGKHSWPWWKEEIIYKWANDSCIFIMEDYFEEVLFNIERDGLISWILKQKDRLTAPHPDMSGIMVHKRILRKFAGDLANVIKRRCIEPFPKYNQINAMEEITTRSKISRNWYKTPIDNQTSGKPISRERPNKPQDRDPLKFYECGIESPLANNCPKKTKINEIGLEKMQDTKEKNEVTVQDSDSEPSEEEGLSDELTIESINVSFKVIKVHTHLPKYTDECMYLIYVQYTKF